MTSHVDRDVAVYHALQKGKDWHAFIVTDVSDKCKDVDALKRSLNAIVQNHTPVAEYKGALFVRGNYDNTVLSQLRDRFSKTLKPGDYTELKGNYFSLSSRYDIWEFIDRQQPVAEQK